MLAVAIERVHVGGLGRAQRFDVEVARGLEHLGVTHRHDIAGAPAHHQAHPAGDVLLTVRARAPVVRSRLHGQLGDDPDRWCGPRLEAGHVDVDDGCRHPRFVREPRLVHRGVVERRSVTVPS